MTMTNSDEYARSGDGGKWEEQPPVMFTRDEHEKIKALMAANDVYGAQGVILDILRKTAVTVTLHTDSDDKGDE